MKAEDTGRRCGAGDEEDGEEVGRGLEVREQWKGLEEEEEELGIW